MDLNGLDFVRMDGPRKDHEVVVYALSTCGHCKRALAFLDGEGVSYRYLYVDKIPIEKKNEIKEELRKRFKTNVAFPFAVIDEKKHLVGFIEPDWVLSLGLGEKR